MNPITVILVDDHDVVRTGLRSFLNTQADVKVVAEARNGQEALLRADEMKPDLVIMDITMPGMDGLEATRQIKEALPQTRIIVLTVRDDDEKLFEALKNGAQGYLLKEIRAQDLLLILRGAMKGDAAISPSLAGRVLAEFRRLSNYGFVEKEDDSGLTEREQQVLARAAQGATDKEIAEALMISLNTVKTHMRNILSKLQVGTRREAARVAKNKGLM